MARRARTPAGDSEAKTGRAAARPLRIAVLIGSETAYGRRVKIGIARYARPHLPWQLFDMGSPRESRYGEIAALRPDGVVAQLYKPETDRLYGRLGVPIVNVSGVLECSRWPRVLPDNRAIGRMAAEHLIALGFKSYAFAGGGSAFFEIERKAGYAGALAGAGFGVEDCALSGEGNAALRRRLCELPKPVAVLAANDLAAVKVADACLEQGIPVPEEIAILGVDNDEIVCEWSFPPVSSVDLQAERIGYEAARLLERLLAGARPPRCDILVAPLEVVTRASTDVLAVSDPDLRAALKLIRERACQGLSVKDICRELPIPRRTLERKFKEALVRSPLDEIHRVRLARAKECMRRHDWPLSEVARRSGFSSVQHLSRCLMAREGVSLRRYLMAIRRNGPPPTGARPV